MRGEFHQAVSPMQDVGITTTKSETASLGKKATTEPTMNIKLKGGAEVSVFEKEREYSYADLCVGRRKPEEQQSWKDSRKWHLSLQCVFRWASAAQYHICEGTLLEIRW